MVQGEVFVGVNEVNYAVSEGKRTVSEDFCQLSKENMVVGEVFVEVNEVNLAVSEGN